MKAKNRHRILFLLVIVVVLFLAVSVYLVYFQLAEAKQLAAHSLNRRNYIDETLVDRGNILDRSGAVLAESVPGEHGFTRLITYPVDMAHIVGYNSITYGKSGIEQSYNDYLLNIQDRDVVEKLRQVVTDGSQGNHVTLTIDHRLQLYANQLLAPYYGSIVALDATTGEVLAMASNPSFDSVMIDQNWSWIIEDQTGPLLNRASQGLYVPGSIMKIITAVAIEESGIDQSYLDQGAETVTGYTFINYNNAAYGEVDLKAALVHSINTYFANKGLAVGAEKMAEVAERFMIGQVVPFDLRTARSSSPYQPAMAEVDLAAAAFGQGTTQVTPLNMALASGAIANGGQMMKPQLVKDIRSPQGSLIRTITPESLSQVTSRSIADKLAGDLEAVVEANPAAGVWGARVGGKTGTAESQDGLVHAWFTGFIRLEGRDVALAVVLENQTLMGGDAASPIAGALFQWILNNYDPS